MARRFGGKYSPDGQARETAPAPAPVVDAAGARSNVLFIPPVLLLFLSLTGGAASLALGLAGAAALGSGAWLLREGLRAQAAFNARKVARAPALPRKTLAALLTGTGIGVAAFRNDPGIAAPVIFALAGTALHLAAFGIDPLKAKGAEGIDQFQQDRVARVVDEAERYLREMQTAIARAGDRALERQVATFQHTAREMLRTVEEDPRDLTAARRYLGVYLMGARDATVKFADLHMRRPDPQARSDYAALLSDLDSSFNARTQKMLLSDSGDLNVEIEVLRERLEREGVRL